MVDPLYPIEPYLAAAESLGVKLSFVIDTHLHADHRSAGRALAQAAGAAYVLHRSAAVGFGYHGVADGDRLELGNVVLDVWHTPGHTPEHLCLVGTDAATGAGNLFASLARLKTLRDDLEVLPGAFAGSGCGRGLSAKPSSTIGFERRRNTAFAMTDGPIL